MRWAVALGWWLAAGFLQAEVAMDLSLPFVQTLLIQEKNGNVTEKAVRKGRVDGEVLEFEKAEGGLLVLPRIQVLALLPRLPQRGEPYLQSQAQRALQILEAVPAQFSQRPEVGADTIAEWRKLGSASTGYDQAQSAALDRWLQRCSQLGSETSLEELEAMQQEGALYRNQFPARSKEIERELRTLKELGGIDLKKIDSVRFELGSLGVNYLGGAVLWALLILPLAITGKALADAWEGFRRGVPLAGLLRLGLAALSLAFLFILLSGDKEIRDRETSPAKPSASTAARKAGWFSQNLKEKWTQQASQKITLPATDWLAFLDEKTEVGSGSESFPFWHLAKPRVLKDGSTLSLWQPVRAKFVTLPFRFQFSAPNPGQSLTDLELTGASLGKIPLGPFFGNLLWTPFQPSYQRFAETCGLNLGIRWLAGAGDTVLIEVPAVQKPKSKPKETLSARELAEAFDEGRGGDYEGKVITVEGSLVGVSSLQEKLGDGTQLKKQDPMDEFILEGLPQGPGRQTPIQINCQFKSSEAYFLDSKGDLFKSAPSAQNPATDIPILRRQGGVTKVRISAGRVESKPTETRLITLYDCRKVEGFDGKEWVLIWGN